jgi:hypothetical protein
VLSWDTRRNEFGLKDMREDGKKKLHFGLMGGGKEVGRFLAIGDIALSCKAAPCWSVLMATSLSRLAGTAFLLLEFRT